MIGDIMSISRLRMGTDGKGVSTLIAFFDCPLNCKYCINDHCHEQKKYRPETPRASFTPEKLLEILKKDNIYYLMTGGGVVFGGGEPLLQSAFIHEVCKLCDSRWSKRIETSLNVPWRDVEPLIDDIDEWIIDIKDMNSKIYKKYTGVSNDNVKRNFYRLIESVDRSKLHIRVPEIEGYNTSSDVKASIEWVKKNLKVEPEHFTYLPIRNGK